MHAAFRVQFIALPYHLVLAPSLTVAWSGTVVLTVNIMINKGNNLFEIEILWANKTTTRTEEVVCRIGL